LTRILVVDDEKTIRSLVRIMVERAGYEVETAADGETGLQLLDNTFSAVMMDLRLPGKDGVMCISEIKQRFPDMPCVVISGADDVKYAVRAMKAGAFDYLRKPLDREELVLVLKQALHGCQLDRENRSLRGALETTNVPNRWIGISDQSKDVCNKTEKIAHSDATVLITGETGTGKSLLARLIHSAGKRAARPFITVSCGTLPRELVESKLFGHEKGAFTGAGRERAGRVEIVGDGTLYLDEVGDLPLSLQSKVLRMLHEREFERVGGNQTHRVHGRVIASTNRDLLGMCRAGEFREDLFSG